MELMKNIGKAARAAAGALGQKHRRTAVLNRIRMVIRCEERAAEKEYLALGRYYYNALRDPQNPVAEPHCQALDGIEKRLDAALGMMQEASSKECIGVIGGWDDDGACPPEEGEFEEIDLSDVECLDEEPGAPLEAAQPEETTLPFEG